MTGFTWVIVWMWILTNSYGISTYEVRVTKILPNSNHAHQELQKCQQVINHDLENHVHYHANGKFKHEVACRIKRIN